MTNQHVVERAADLKIQVTTNDGKTYNAHYITGDEKKDLAFIKIDAEAAFPYISLDNVSPNLLGQTVIVVGNAVGYGSSISRGVLSAIKRDITIENIEYKNLVQTDAAINPGNSGGPVIDLSARLVGVSSAKMAFTPQGVPTQGLGFAIPADVVRDSVAEFRKFAEKRPTAPTESEVASSTAERLFGIQLQDLSAELTTALGFAPNRGVLISAVEPDSPADRGGSRAWARYLSNRQIRRDLGQTNRESAQPGQERNERRLCGGSDPRQWWWSARCNSDPGGALRSNFFATRTAVGLSDGIICK